MDFTFKDWAEDLCNKFEKMCEENVMIQNSSRYINVVGDRIQMVVEEVKREFLGPDGSHNALMSELSLDPNISTEVSENSTSRLDILSVESSTCTKMGSADSSMEIISPATATEVCEDSNIGLDSSIENSTCIKMFSVVSPKEIIDSSTSSEVYQNSTSGLDSPIENSTCIKSGLAGFPTKIISPSSTDDSGNLSQKDVCDEENDKLSHHKLISQCKAAELNCSSDAQENAKDVLDPIMSANDLMGGKDDQKERVFIHTVQILETEDYDASAKEGTEFLVRCPDDEHDQQNKLENLDASVKLPEFEIIAPSYREAMLDPFVTYPSSTSETANEFEDVNLNDSAGDTEDDILDFMSHREHKNKSFKGKIKDAIISKMRLRRVRNDGSHSLATDVKVQNKPPTNSSLDLSDSDWELL